MEAVALFWPSMLTCIAEKGAAKTLFSYNDLKNNPPDRKNLIHVLVRFP